MSATTKAILNLLALAVSTVPPAACVLMYFPLWLDRGAGAAISGIALLLLLVAAIPLFKTVTTFLKSPSAPLMWFFVFIVFLMLSKIADEVTVIAFVGFVSNLIGSLIFRITGKGGECRDEAD